MLNCQQCSAPIKLNGKYCSQCGWPISEADNLTFARDLEAQVAVAQRLFGENKVQEAVAQAEAVLLGDPDNIAALALKGDCLEREGDITGALECYEHVVTLKPDSPLDRIRVAHLRRLATVQPYSADERPERKNTVLAAAATFVMLAATGSALVLANRNEPAAAETKKPDSGVVSRPFLPPAPVPSSRSDKSSNAKADTGGGTSPTTERTDEGDDRAQNEAAIPLSDRLRHTPNTGRVIDPVGNQLAKVAPEGGFEPVSPDVTAVNEPATKTEGDPDPNPVKTDNPGGDTHAATTRPPVIDIRPSQGSHAGSSNGGSKPREGDGNEGKTLIQVAREYFLAGEYDKAAKAYERAIKLGASPASANHRLAQCYVNLNRRAEALSAYKRALSAYQSMLDQGIGDKRLIESYVNECRQFIKMLQ